MVSFLVLSDLLDGEAHIVSDEIVLVLPFRMPVLQPLLTSHTTRFNRRTDSCTGYAYHKRAPSPQSHHRSPASTNFGYNKKANRNTMAPVNKRYCNSWPLQEKTDIIRKLQNQTHPIIPHSQGRPALTATDHLYQSSLADPRQREQ